MEDFSSIFTKTGKITRNDSKVYTITVQVSYDIFSEIFYSQNSSYLYQYVE